MSDAKGRISPVEELRLLRAATRDWRFSRGDLGTFAVVLRHCDSERRAFPGPTLIAQEANLAAANVKKSLKRLEQWRYLEIERPGLRKANRYVVLEGPPVPPRRSGMRTLRNLMGKQPTRPGRARIPSKVAKSAMETPATGCDRVAGTGDVGAQQLGMPARREDALKALFKSQKALDQKNHETPEEERRLRKRAAEAYLRAKADGNAQLMAHIESAHRHRIADLMEAAR